MIRAVLFDLDQTLVDHLGTARKALEQWAVVRAPTHHPLSKDAWKRWLALEELHFASYLRGECSYAEQRNRRMADFLAYLDIDAHEDQYGEWFDDYRRHYEGHWVTFEDVVPTLDTLVGPKHDLPLGILTNGSSKQQRAKVEHVGLSKYFDVVLVSEEIGCSKPDPAAFYAACRELGVNPTETLHVGDRCDLDYDAALAAGLQAVLIDREGLSTGDSVITSLSEVFQFLPQPTIHKG